MKTKLKGIVILLALFAGIHQLAAQGTAFRYQGHLIDSGSPANGSYNLMFNLYDNPTSGYLWGSQTNYNTGVTNGLFFVTLDFGAVFAGTNFWLETDVCTNGSFTFTNLSPRQQLFPTPYAIYAENAGNANYAYNAGSANYATSAGIVSLTLPYSGSANSSSPLFTLNNSGIGAAAAFLGNVGIGTASPTETLDVNGGIRATGSSTAASGTGVEIDYNGGGDNNGRIFAYNRTGSAYVGLGLGDYAHNKGILIEANGKVGIGTTSPANLLSVAGNADFSGNTRFTTTNGAAVQGLHTPSGAYGQLGYGSTFYNGGLDIYQTNGYGVYGNAGTIAGDYAGFFDGAVNINGNLSASSITANSISSSGMVIGSDSTTAPLNVAGYLTATLPFTTPVAYIQNSYTGANSSPALRLVGYGNTVNGVLNVSAEGTGLIAQFGNANNFVADIKTNGTIDAVAFNTTSDRNMKDNFTGIDSRSVLEKVAALPISKWNFKEDPSTRHLGPMAQDFYAAFGVGSDDKHIATVDEDGVALAAIQGLDEKVEQERIENTKLKQQNDSLEKRLDELEAAVESLTKTK